MKTTQQLLLEAAAFIRTHHRYGAVEGPDHEGDGVVLRRRLIERAAELDCMETISGTGIRHGVPKSHPCEGFDPGSVLVREDLEVFAGFTTVSKILIHDHYGTPDDLATLASADLAGRVRRAVRQRIIDARGQG